MGLTLGKLRTADKPFVESTTTGIVVDRAHGFVSAWQTFDVGQPGVGYGRVTITAEDADGESWGDQPGEISSATEIEVCQDNAAWLPLPTVAPVPAFSYPSNPVGDVAAVLVTTPRYVRFRLTVMDSQSGYAYPGANDPSLTYSLYYVAG